MLYLRRPAAKDLLHNAATPKHKNMVSVNIIQEMPGD